MQRTVVVPAELTFDALEELKSWLGISRPNEDHALIDLLRASLAMCEAVIGQVPLEQVTEERLSPQSGRHSLVSRPIREVLATEALDSAQSRIELASDKFEYEFGPHGAAVIQLRHSIDAVAVIARMRVGIAHTWSELPPALKQGVIRLAAHHYRDRDGAEDSAPPASVTALWRPWRRLAIS